MGWGLQPQVPAHTHGVAISHFAKVPPTYRVPTYRHTDVRTATLSSYYRLAHGYAAHGHTDMRPLATLKALSASARRRGGYAASNC